MAELSFTLLSRLPDGHRPPGEAWKDWRYAAEVMPQAEYGDPNDAAPYKRYPGTRDYFAPQVEEALFPRASGPKDEGGRWIRRPAAWWLGIGDGQNDFELAVDLLEI